MSRLAELLRATFVIGRRDFVATVFSRTFALFLFAPMFPVIFGGVFASVNAGTGASPARDTIVLVGVSPHAQSIRAARARLAEGGLGVALPDLASAPVHGKPGDQAARILHDGGDRTAVLLNGSPPTLVGPAPLVERLRAPVSLLLDEAARHGAGTPTPLPAIGLRAVAPPPSEPDRGPMARIAQTVLFGLTILLASMLLSNMIEEKSNKVIEVLAAAVPVRAIFLGKLFAMLAISLVGLCVWGATGVAATLAIGGVNGLPSPPGVGWPAFAVLSVCYFATNYLLLGALFLGLGSHASSVRQVQTMSMPVTMAQLVLFAFAGTVANDPGGTVAHAAMLLPWSSPMAMLGLAAQRGALWPHLLALAWQALWVGLTIVAAAALFRRNVLKSGGSAPSRVRRR